MTTTVQLCLLTCALHYTFGIQRALLTIPINNRQHLQNLNYVWPQIHNVLQLQIQDKLWPQIQRNLGSDFQHSHSLPNERWNSSKNDYFSRNFTEQASWDEKGLFFRHEVGEKRVEEEQIFRLRNKNTPNFQFGYNSSRNIIRDSFDEIANIFRYVNWLNNCKLVKPQNLEEVVTGALQSYFEKAKTQQQTVNMSLLEMHALKSSAHFRNEESKCSENQYLRSPNDSELDKIIQCMKPGLVHHLSENILHLKLFIRNYSNQLQKNNNKLKGYLCVGIFPDVDILTETCLHHVEKVLSMIDTEVAALAEYQKTHRRIGRSTKKNSIDDEINPKKPTEIMLPENKEQMGTSGYQKPVSGVEIPIEYSHYQNEKSDHRVELKLLGALTLGAYGITSMLFLRQFLLEIPNGIGLPGIPGEKGGAGEKGIEGSIGMKGIKGTAGDKGLQGAEGEPGKAGIPGPKGEIGDPGPLGDQGIKGLRGDSGPAGLPGRKGEFGSPGEKGPTAEKGEQGQPGMPGMKGEQGDQGNDGEKGDKGIKGDTGMKGDKGLQGDTGPRGPDGSRGSKGDKGREGDRGMKGNKGMKGEKGMRGDDVSEGTTESDWEAETTPSPIDEDVTDYGYYDNEDLKRKNKRDVSDVSDAPLLLTLLYESKVLPYSLENTLGMNSTSTWDLEPFSNEGIEENLKVLLENHEYKNNIHVTSDGDPFRSNGSYNIDDAHSYKNNQDKLFHSKLRATHPNRGHKKQLNRPNQASQKHIDDREISAGIRDTPQLLSLLYRRKTEEDTKSRKVVSRKCSALDSINELWTEYQDPAGCVKCSLFEFFKSSDADLESYIMAGMAFVLGVQDSYQVQDAVREARVNNREIECKRNKTTCFIVSDEIHHESARRFKKGAKLPSSV